MSASTDGNAAIRVSGLTRRFGSLTAVDGIDFTVKKGEVFGFLGPNGAGKTTTVRMLTGVIDPTEGSASIQGHDITSQPLQSREHIAVVPEQANVYRDLSVWRNIMLMAELYGIPRDRREKTAREILQKLGLSGRVRSRARELSKGLKQRLMLCAAIVTEPDILFLDEPTSGLDVQSARLIREIVKDLNRRGLTVFLTTHNMAEAGEMCSRVAIIKKGSIVAVDSPESLRSGMRRRHYVRAVFAGEALPPDDLESIAGVIRVERGDSEYRLFTESPGEVATALAGLATSAGLELEELQTRKPSLEDVFLYYMNRRTGEDNG
ncbi:MAG: ATP-binding cassette domain-containing protein [Candidatus Aegiribacteria sp.]|nr:ATP-binding cassette domain-containing protein [Candidatus Aegiribacteria sp.]MBD3295519.1 ATP-binding cassette domain-containing protein [Candidatus Fermentibacteria bacterium]